MANPAKTVDQNLLPVQAYFNLDGTFNTFIGQNMPFYATVNPSQSGLTITNSTIDSTIIGANSPSTGSFTNITTTTGQVTTSPSGNTDITNKLYVDTVAQGLGPKAACQCGTLANITLSGLQTIDGYTTLAGDRVLVKNQTTQANNGIYIASTTTWSRSADMDVWSEVSGAYTVVLNGSQAETGWVCTSPTTGTIGVTAITWVQFSTVNTYYAGTGLSLSSNTFSITNIGTAGTYGSASAVPVFVTNAQGQVTSVTNTPISIANTQVTGLGTMSTQNANSVAITGGSIDGTTIGGSTASAITGTTITATSSFSGSGSGLTGTASGLSIGGNAATATSATTAGSVTNSITFNSSGSGGSSPVTYNGSTAPTISYNTIGAPSTSGTNASGTWGISITGNSATVTNGVYTTGSYSNPTWITSILGSIVSGAVANATSATNLSGGTAGALAYQSGVGATTFLTLGTTNYVLTSSGSAPQYVAQSTLSVGSAATATSATTATNLAGGIASQIPYQSAAGTTAFIANGTSGQFLQSNGTGAPTWATPTSYATVTDDTTTNGTCYPLFANQTSGNLSTEYTSSTKLQYNPSTGVFTSTSFSGAGTGLTGTASSLSIGGNAATATSATSATTSTNLAGGLAGYLPYQSAVNTTTFLAPGTNGYILTLASGLPTWAVAPATGVTITDDTSSATAYYPLFARITSGTATTEYTSSTNLQYTPSTGLLSALLVTSTGTLTAGSASTTYVQVKGDAAYPGVYATGGTNTPLVLSPLGTGALQAQKTDSTATGGNARGANAVDWQTSRGVAGEVASGSTSVLVGGINNASTNTAVFLGGGVSNTASGSYSVLSGGWNNISGGVLSNIVGGYGNGSSTQLGYFNFIGGGQSNTGTANAAVTTQATTTVTSGSTAVTLSASNAAIKVGQLITGTGMATWTYVAAISGTALTLSQNANATGTPTLSFFTPHGVVVGGGNNQATGSYSFIGGGGDAGTAANRNVASGDWSAILGGRGGTTRGITGYQAFPACSIPIASGAGYSQGGLLVLGTQTTNATATVITSDGLVASTSNQVILPNNSAYYFKVSVIAGVTGAGNTKAWTLEGAIKRGAGVGTTAIVGTVTTNIVAADAGASTWTVTATADTTNGGLAITFTGQAATTIRVVAKAETCEMTF